MLFLLSLAPSHAWSPDLELAPVESREVKFKARTELDFDTLDVVGALVGPEGALVLERPAMDFPPMFRLRADFGSEMLASLDVVK